MFKAIRVAILLFILLMVVVGTWLAEVRSTDWNNSLWVKIYPINGDGSKQSDEYISSLSPETFAGIEQFVAREVERYGHKLAHPVRIELGRPVREQPPVVGDTGSALDIMLWSLRMRWWVASVTDDELTPDVRMFVRYHSPEQTLALDNSVGVQRGMYGVVNAYSSRKLRGRNNVVIAHEFLHTLGATDKYDPSSAQPLVPDGIAEPGRSPLYPQKLAEIMGGRIPLAADDAVIPQSLRFVVIGPTTAHEIRLTEH
jgi:hypothetical protein